MRFYAVLILFVTAAPIWAISIKRQPPPVLLDLSQLHDITGIEKLPPSHTSGAWRQWAAILLVSFLCLCFVARWMIRASLGKGRESLPDEWALTEFDRIDAMALAAHGRGEQHHALLSDTVRHYLESRYGPPAMHLTTAEFLTASRQSLLVPAEQQELLREILERCDMAKFARIGVSSEECALTGKMARAFVLQTGTREIKTVTKNGQATASSTVGPNQAS